MKITNTAKYSQIVGLFDPLHGQINYHFNPGETVDITDNHANELKSLKVNGLVFEETKLEEKKEETAVKPKSTK